VTPDVEGMKMTGARMYRSVAKEAQGDGSFRIKVYEGNCSPRIIECADEAEADRVYYTEFGKQNWK
jgi:hypothetical protein